MKKTHNFQIGQHVKVIDEDCSGEIVDIQKDCIYIICDRTGMTLHFHPGKFIAKTNDEEKMYHRYYHQNIENKAPKEKVRKPKKEKSPYRIINLNKKGDKAIEIDLHFANMPHKYVRTKHEILLHQLEKAREAIEYAGSHHIRYVILIHGIGKGVLKQEIIHLLKGMQNIEYNDAPYERYGKGALMVKIYGS